MAVSKCVKCDSTRFELKAMEPADSRYRLYAVQCAACGGVVGVLEGLNTGVLLKKLAQKLGVSI
jgi:translation initiation factor 2 beta subunit (eIF-2beta)/eIF-5